MHATLAGSSYLAEDAEAKALRLAAAEGLVLVRSNNKTGFSNVHQYRRSCSYHVESSTDGKRETLGTFATAAEAALAYARYLGPERSHALAEKPRAKPPARIKDDHEFGQPRIPTAASSTSLEVACVAADDDDDYDDDDGLAVVYAETAATHGGAGSPSDATTTPTAATAAPALKKRRVVHEYERSARREGAGSARAGAARAVGGGRSWRSRPAVRRS